MENSFWINKWRDGDIGFHQSQGHPLLKKLSDRFLPGTILVPLCGKTVDMIHLANLGHSVIGVELSRIACKDFFEENKISFTESSDQEFSIFNSEKITIWCGDFFKLPPEVWDSITGIYDRAALVALPEELRKKYANEICRKTRKPMIMLLITFEYSQEKLSGPPFSVSSEEVHELYQNFKIEKIHSHEVAVRQIAVTEVAYLIQ